MKSSDHLRRKMALFMAMKQRYHQIFEYPMCQNSDPKTKQCLISAAKSFTSMAFFEKPFQRRKQACTSGEM